MEHTKDQFSGTHAFQTCRGAQWLNCLFLLNLETKDIKDKMEYKQQYDRRWRKARILFQALLNSAHSCIVTNTETLGPTSWAPVIDLVRSLVAAFCTKRRLQYLSSVYHKHVQGFPCDLDSMGNAWYVVKKRRWPASDRTNIDNLQLEQSNLTKNSGNIVLSWS